MALPITVESVVPASRAAAIVSLCQLLSDRLPTRKASRPGAEVGATDVCVMISRLAAGMGVGPGWSAALGWSILPAALGNILGGFLLVVIPFWIAFDSKHRDGGGGESDAPRAD